MGVEFLIPAFTVGALGAAMGMAVLSRRDTSIDNEDDDPPSRRD